jgi:hypothetical protein
VRAGGLNYDYGASVAVRGSSIYVVGSVSNNSRNYGNVLFGSTVQYGIGYNTNFDVVLAKYTDQGSSAPFNWVQAAGGTGYDQGFGVAVSATGSSVYVTGTLVNNQANDNAVVFGASGTTVGTSVQPGAATGSAGGDMFVAKYTDNGPTGSFNWCQVGGGTGFDQGYGLAVSGSSVYVTGYLINDVADYAQVRFGGSGPGRLRGPRRLVWVAHHQHAHRGPCAAAEQPQPSWHPGRHASPGGRRPAAMAQPRPRPGHAQRSLTRPVGAGLRRARPPRPLHQGRC